MLLQQLDAANRVVWLSVPAQVLAMGVLIWLVDWQQVASNPLLPSIAIAFMVGPLAMGILTGWAQKKKEIGDLREETRFGQYDKYRLQALFKDTLQRLDLPEVSECGCDASGIRRLLQVSQRCLSQPPGAA
jgi:hypothetical protein